MLRYLCWAALLILGTACIARGAVFLYETRSLLTQGQKTAASNHDRASRQIGAYLGEGVRSADRLANNIRLTSPETPELLSLMHQALADAAGLTTLIVAFEPGTGPDAAGAKFLAWRDGDTIHTVRRPDSAHLDPDNHWYYAPLTHGRRFGGSFVQQASGEMVADYGTPITGTDDVPIGVVSAGFSVRDIRATMESIQLGRGGYAFLFNDSGDILIHPDRDLEGSLSNLFDVAEATSDPILWHVVSDAINGRHGPRSYTHPVTGEAAWLYTQQVPHTQWTLAALQQPDALRASNTTSSRALRQILPAALLAATAACILALFAAGFRPVPVWSSAIGLSCLYVAATAIVVSTPTDNDHHLTDGSTVLADGTAVRNLVAEIDGHRRTRGENPPLFQPTGLLINTIQVQNDRELVISGTLWQRLSISAPEISPVRFVQAKEQTWRRAFQREEADGQVTGWHFRVLLPYTADLRHYPFDSTVLRLRMAPSDPSQDVVLIPDLDAYASIRPRALPGIDNALQVAEWHLIESRFVHRSMVTQTSFGVSRDAESGRVHELAFEVAQSRRSFGPFMATVTPVIVTAVIAFLILTVSFVGSKQFDIIRALLPLLIVVVFLHVGLRQSSTYEGLIYLEMYYLLLYGQILIVVILSIAHALETVQWRWLRHQDNFIARTLYWPVTTLTALCCTLAMFS
ncbi:cache domain-containing protein [uncultured Abyssibacter sp.]|uniref:cache domain-containing protein n=1 Tax=uncultured Abyssibacter sp. TaxID=2320202 RepID=UPI0032B14DA0